MASANTEKLRLERNMMEMFGITRSQARAQLGIAAALLNKQKPADEVKQAPVPKRDLTVKVEEVVLDKKPLPPVPQQVAPPVQQGGAAAGAAATLTVNVFVNGFTRRATITGELL